MAKPTPHGSSTKIKVKHGIHIAKSPPEVFEYLADPDRMSEWQSTTFDMKGKDKANAKGKLQRGTKVHDRRNVLGKKIDGEWEVVEFVQDKKLAMTVTKGPVPWEMTFELEPLEKGTWLSVEGGGDMGQLPMSHVAASRACQRLLEEDLEALANILER